MPPRDPSIPQIDFPVLVADIITQLQIRGQVGLLAFNPSVQPIYIAAAREGVSLGTLTTPAFDTGQTFTNFTTGIIAANTVLADSGQLVAGTHDIWAQISTVDCEASGIGGQFLLIHRNAADTADIDTLEALPLTQTQVNSPSIVNIPLSGRVFAANERLVWRVGAQATLVLSQVQTTIWAAARANP